MVKMIFFLRPLGESQLLKYLAFNFFFYHYTSQKKNKWKNSDNKLVKHIYSKYKVFIINKTDQS